ncbi:MAG: hypothetical protein AAB475_00850 [Patescibacteria group bacterium]
MRYSKDFLNEKYKLIPEVVKDAMGSVDRANLIRSIAEKYKLHIDQTGLLFEEIIYVTLGVEKTSDFVRNLKVYLHISKNKVNAVAGDVNEKIFLPIREALKKAVETPPAEFADDLITGQAEIKNQELEKTQTQKEIHHSPLNEKNEKFRLVTGLLSDESEEIKQQIREQQAVKSVIPPPPQNPPTQSDELKNPHLETRSPNEQRPSFENKKPFRIDPYREPIE